MRILPDGPKTPTGQSVGYYISPLSLSIKEISCRRQSKRASENNRKLILIVIAATFSLLGMILWLSRWYSPEGRLTPDQVSEEVTKIALSGLLRPEA